MSNRSRQFTIINTKYMDYKMGIGGVFAGQELLMYLYYNTR